jgi:hypothetical protein
MPLSRLSPAVDLNTVFNGLLMYHPYPSLPNRNSIFFPCYRQEKAESVRKAFIFMKSRKSSDKKNIKAPFGTAEIFSWKIQETLFCGSRL